MPPGPRNAPRLRWRAPADRVSFTRYQRPLAEGRRLMLARAHGRAPNRNPFEFVDPREVESAFAGLRSLDHAEWAAAFGALANAHAERRRDADGQARGAAAHPWGAGP